MHLACLQHPELPALPALLLAGEQAVLHSADYQLQEQEQEQEEYTKE
jgi:hypothetical protein